MLLPMVELMPHRQCAIQVAGDAIHVEPTKAGALEGHCPPFVSLRAAGQGVAVEEPRPHVHHLPTASREGQLRDGLASARPSEWHIHRGG
jgi:hypothetical protein